MDKHTRVKFDSTEGQREGGFIGKDGTHTTGFGVLRNNLTGKMDMSGLKIGSFRSLEESISKIQGKEKTVGNLSGKKNGNSYEESVKKENEIQQLQLQKQQQRYIETIQDSVKDSGGVLLPFNPILPKLDKSLLSPSVANEDVKNQHKSPLHLQSSQYMLHHPSFMGHHPMQHMHPMHLSPPHHISPTGHVQGVHHHHEQYPNYGHHPHPRYIHSSYPGHHYTNHHVDYHYSRPTSSRSRSKSRKRSNVRSRKKIRRSKPRKDKKKKENSGSEDDNGEVEDVDDEDDDDDDSPHYTHQTIRPIQNDCCIKGCKREVKNRLRFSLKCTEEHELKQEYIRRSWNKICHHHYFSDLYQYKKKQKQLGEGTEMGY